LTLSLKANFFVRYAGGEAGVHRVIVTPGGPVVEKISDVAGWSIVAR
jgi:hypothetical protein